MQYPRRINHLLHVFILVVADFMVGALLFGGITLLHPQLRVIFPRAIVATALPVWGEIVLFAFYWVAAMGLSGLYRHLGKKGFGQYSTILFAATFVGMVFFTFFFFVKNDFLYEYGFFHFFFEVWLAVFVAFWGLRAIYYLIVWRLVAVGRLAKYALLVGNTSNAEAVYHDFLMNPGWIRYFFVGYVKTDGDASGQLNDHMVCLGMLDDLSDVVQNQKVDEVVIAIDTHDFRRIEQVLAIVRQYDITVKLLPDLNSIIEGAVKTDNIKGLPLITLNNQLMPVWQQVMKWAFDKIVSVAALLLFLPFFPLVVVGIKMSSQGPIFYYQTRLGKGRHSFKMVKFRSMYLDAENGGPALSSDNDPRITPFGRFMRKWHIDEVPQFFNVLIGDMSIVGPRPEREFFIDQILKIAPHYGQLFSVKPGITSWGMVKYGYAENVDQMVERLKYDILYLENISFGVDLKIIAHTVNAVFKGHGK